MNADQSKVSITSHLEAPATTDDSQTRTHTGTLTPELLNLVSGGDTVLCW